MSAKENVAFRSAVGGYNREDVNRYILHFNRELEEKEAAVQKERSALEARVAEADDSVSSANAERDAALADKESVLATLSTVQEELASLREKLALLEEENVALTAELATRPLPETDSDKSEKSEKYDQISSQIGDIMISASASADAIVAAANEQASKILSETEKEAHDIRTRLSDTADQMLRCISSELYTSTDHCYSELMGLLKEMQDNTENLIRNFENKSRDLSLKVEYYQSAVTETVESVLSKMDEEYGIKPTIEAM